MVNDGTNLCSEDCRREWLSDTFTGDGHPNWKGGGTGPYGKGGARIRRLGLERDGYRCVVCGTSASDLGRNPDVHHIVPVRAFVEDDAHDRTAAHRLDNVVSLCVGCHRRADYGVPSKGPLRALIDVEEPG